MQFYFIRHAQSENNLLWARTGSEVGRSQDAELSQVGWQQAERLANFLAQMDGAPGGDSLEKLNVNDFGLTHLYTSLMARAVATGSLVARVLGLPLLAWEDAHEWGGIYLKDEVSGERVGQPGKNRAYFETHYPDMALPDGLDEAGWWRCRPYESDEQQRTRARRFVDDLIQRHGRSQDRVAVISHGGFYNLFLATLFNLPELNGYRFNLNNTAISRIDFRMADDPSDGSPPGDAPPGGLECITCVYMNRFDFLPKELIT